MTIKLIKISDNLPKISYDDIVGVKRSFEWFYFDFRKDKCKVIMIFNIKDPLTDLKKPSGWFEYIDEGKNIKKQHVEIFENYSLNVNDYNFVLKFDENVITFTSDEQGVINHVEIVVKNKIYEGKISIDSKTRGFKYSDDGYYLFDKQGKKVGGAIFAIPSYEASLNIKYMNNVEIKGNGFKGYTDHPFGLECLSLTHKTWMWGHFENEKFAIQYSQVTAFKKYESKLNYCVIHEIEDDDYTTLSDMLYNIPDKSLVKNKFGLKYPMYYMIFPNLNDNTPFTANITNITSLFDISVYNRSEGTCRITLPFIIENLNGLTEYVNIKEYLKYLFYLIYKRLHKKILVK